MKKTLTFDATPEPKKKKKKIDYQLAKVAKNSSPSELNSIMSANSKEILRLLEAKENDAAIPLIYKAMLQTVVDLIPFAENVVRETKGTKGIYGLNIIISSVRELMVDIQAAQDRGLLGQSLLAQVIKPCFSDIAQEVVREYAAISADAKGLMEVQDYKRFQGLLTDSRSRLADSMTRSFKEASQGTIDYLQR